MSEEEATSLDGVEASVVVDDVELRRPVAAAVPPEPAIPLDRVDPSPDCALEIVVESPLMGASGGSMGSVLSVNATERSRYL